MIGSYKLVHKILNEEKLVGLMAWDVTIADPCDDSLLNWELTPSDSTTEITVANTDTDSNILIKLAKYSFKDPNLFDTTLGWSILDSSLPRPCYDKITYTISLPLPSSISSGSTNGSLRVSSIPTGDAQLLTITFDVTFSNSKNPGTSEKTFSG